MTAPIVTVTLNPAIDQTIVVDQLTLGAVHRARSSQSNAGGKGVNVAGCLADWGAEVIVTGVLGRDNAAPFEAFFAAKRIDDRFVRAPGETRTNIKIADLATRDTTDVNLPGLAVDAAAYAAVDATLRRVARPGTLVVVAGSLPAGMAEDTLAELVGDLAGLGARVVLDTSGEPLRRALAPGRVPPHCIKPNRAELEDLVGRPLAGDADLLAAARELVARGIALVVISRGAEGALFVTAARALVGRLPPVAALSTVGAGDAMVAGLVAALAEGAEDLAGGDDLAEGAGLERVARLAVAFAAAKLAGVGPNLPSITAVEDLAARVVLAPPNVWEV